MSKKIKFESGAYFMTNALRQLGYTNYTAIADIIDNSIEGEVGSKNVFIDLIKCEEDKTTFSDILISDDGCGMDEETILSCMRLGSRTGKDYVHNLGVYGAGLKTAAISIGRRLTVHTKTEEGNLFRAILDIDQINDTEDTIDVEIEAFNDDSDEYKFFNTYTKSTHGTIIQISKLDRIQNKDYRGFEGTLSKKIRIIFNKFIDSDDCAFIVNGKKLSYFDTIGNKNGMGTELIDEGDFTYNNSVINWKGWYIPKSVQDAEFDNGFGRTNSDAGIYVYRQMRLVGGGLDLGMCQKTGHWTNGFRFELFMDGSADKIFGTTFTKMITERDKSGIEQGFYDKLKTIVSPLANQCAKTQKRETNEEKVSDEIKNQLKRTVVILNKKTLLANTVRQKGTNEKTGESKPKNPNPKPQTNPNPHKRRYGDWLEGFEFVSEGETGFMYDIEKRNGKAVVLINQDHAFYEHIFKQLDDDGRYNMSLYLACEYSAMENSDYYKSEDAEKYIKSYKISYGDAVRRAFI